MSNDVLNEEELTALALLGENRRLMITIVPSHVPSDFVARLTAWNSFLLDVRLEPPMILPVTMKGNGLVCPYCGSPAVARYDAHPAACDWRQAIERWASAQLQIEKDFGAVARHTPLS